MGDVFTRLHPSLKRVIEGRNWKSTDVQSSSIDTIIEGKNALLVAPTGSGKTMAAMLPLLHKCLEEKWQGLSILYITPLRALNRDVDRRLIELCNEIGLRVDVRHGDTKNSQRQKQVRKPPNVLITTPETFQLMFTGHRIRELLISTRCVIIDEIHDLISSERGWQLEVGLSRLEHLKGSKIQRIGLSATVGNPQEVSKWLGEDVSVIASSSPRETKLLVEAVPVEVEDQIGSMELGISPQAHATLRGLCQLVAHKSPCLIFVNSRNAAETIGQRLPLISPNLRIGVHHGSLAKETRQEMETNLQIGKLDALVCTSSLELGIDIGSISQVLQLRSPRSVDRMLQRVGRADHRVGGIGRGYILSWESDDIAECAVIGRKAMAGEIEPITWRQKPFSVAANQLVMMAHSFGTVPLKEVTEIFSKSSQFPNWVPTDTEDIAQILADRWLIRFETNPEKIPWYDWPAAVWKWKQNISTEALPERPKRVHGEDVPKSCKEISITLPERFKSGWISQSGKTRDWVTSHLSMIPDKTMYKVRDAVTRRQIGNVDESFVLTLNDSGEDEDGTKRTFVMAGRTWVIVDADPEQTELLVTPAKDLGQAPHWVGELPPTPESVAMEIGHLRKLVARDFGFINMGEDEYFCPFTGEELTRKVSDYPMGEEAQRLITEMIVDHIEITGSIPSNTMVTVEVRKDAIVVNSCFGTRINEALGHFLLAMSTTTSGKWGRLLVESTRFSIQAPDIDPESLVLWLSQTPPEALESVLTVSLPNSREVRWRFAQVAKTFGILRKGTDPRKINLQALLKRYKGTVVLDEVLGKLFHERMDVVGAKDVLQLIQSGRLLVEITAAGPLGLSEKNERDLLLPNWDNQQVREKLENRLMNERAVLCCLRCYAVRRFRVARFAELKQSGSCLKCGGFMLACAREGLEKQLISWVQSKEKKDMDRMQKNAESVKSRGIEAIIALMGRGVGEATCQRILRKVRRGRLDDLYEAIHLSEIEYARTRRFW